MIPGELAIYDALPLSEYEIGIRDGVESAVRRFAQLRYNHASQHIHPTNEIQDQVCYLRIDHIDEVLIAMLRAVQS